ncbi:MAG: UTRA domain-containing protein [Burkholderiaceae bacterium]
MQAHYLTVKRAILGEIGRGLYAPGDRLPSESELTARFKVSRPTISRALRELQHEGAVIRVAGVGSFVAQIKHDAPVSMVQNIAEEIRGDGQAYDCIVHELGTTSADGETAARLQVRPRSRVFRSVVVHRGNEIPMQLEYRLVNPQFCPGYLQADLVNETAHQVLMRAGVAERVEHTIEAVLPSADMARLLEISTRAPCLSVQRRTFARNLVASVAHLVYPGNRYRISGAFDTVIRG